MNTMHSALKLLKTKTQSTLQKLSQAKSLHEAKATFESLPTWSQAAIIASLTVTIMSTPSLLRFAKGLMVSAQTPALALPPPKPLPPPPPEQKKIASVLGVSGVTVTALATLVIICLKKNPNFRSFILGMLSKS